MGKKKRTKQHKGQSQTEPRQSSAFTSYKYFLLALTSLGILYIYFSIPLYNMWLKSRIFRYYQQIPHQLETTDIDQKLFERHYYNYLIPRRIQEQTPDSAVILLPSDVYAKENFSQRFFYWTRPAWNYYFFGPRNYVKYKSETEQDFSNVTHAIICGARKNDSNSIRDTFLLSKSKPLMPPLRNEKGENVEIRLVIIDSKETLLVTLDDYQNVK